MTEEIYIRTSGGDLFKVLTKDVGPCSKTLRELIEDMTTNTKMISGDMKEEDAIPLPNISAPTFKKIIDYCKEHAKDAEVPDTPKKTASLSAHQETTFDEEFMKDMTFKDIEPIVTAANYLDIRGLIDLCARAIARAIAGKTPKEVYAYFGQEYREISAEQRKKYEEENPFLKGE